MKLLESFDNNINNLNSNSLSNSQSNSDTNLIKATLPVDHCRIRSLDEIKTEMCKIPVKTTKCIKLPQFDFLIKNENKDQNNVCSTEYKSSTKIIKELNENGYYIFKNMINEEEIINSLNSFKNNLVNYNKLKDEFIDKSILKNVNQSINTNLLNIKFKVSHSKGNNKFRRNLEIKNEQDRVPIYTILTFLDGGNIEVFPGTNKKSVYNNFKLTRDFEMIKRIKLNSGDVIIFESTLIHRIKLLNTRTYIQLFDTVLESDIDYYLEHILHVPCLEDSFFNNSFDTGFLNQICDRVLFINSTLGNNKLPIHFITDYEDIRYISQDYNKSHIEIKNNEFQEANVYIFNFDAKDMNETERNLYLLISLIVNNLILIFIFIVTLLVLYFCINIIFKD